MPLPMACSNSPSSGDPSPALLPPRPPNSVPPSGVPAAVGSPKGEGGSPGRKSCSDARRVAPGGIGSGRACCRDRFLPLIVLSPLLSSDDASTVFGLPSPVEDCSQALCRCGSQLLKNYVEPDRSVVGEQWIITCRCELDLRERGKRDSSNGGRCGSRAPRALTGSMVFEPIGVQQAGRVIVRFSDDGLKKGLLFGHGGISSSHGDSLILPTAR
jgi:hypothetical protein